ncbi:hypothetical protein PUN28_017015 [Cardiocondyla obscurior]|uniref:C2H2-type domain-containing protein n=1 Tax=Cardiocondyla obscurior TaxID=286306 RepID=A0AAW2EJX5_9HYME
MNSLKCCLCNHRISGWLNGLMWHYEVTHGLTSNREMGNTGFSCVEDGCYRTFKYFYTFRRHIRQYSNEDVHDDNYENLNINLHSSIIRVIARLQSKRSVTGAIVNDILDEWEEIIFNLTKFL